ncbi:MAG: DNA-binding protein [Candidatus Dadabacteria bacterium]|nr:DNA-binding protein [Candidatus Dadabacteria bacterium]MYC40466.1 DNA-binding protein [Candidatus Dadabacteria bacterium]
MEERTEKEHVSNHVDIESKRFFFDVKENHKGQYLRITELSGGRSSIVVPFEGIEQFRDKLVETIKESLELVGN